jgi:hypothetical protein
MMLFFLEESFRNTFFYFIKRVQCFPQVDTHDNANLIERKNIYCNKFLFNPGRI